MLIKKEVDTKHQNFPISSPSLRGKEVPCVASPGSAFCFVSVGLCKFVFEISGIHLCYRCQRRIRILTCTFGLLRSWAYWFMTISDYNLFDFRKAIFISCFFVVVCIVDRVSSITSQRKRESTACGTLFRTMPCKASRSWVYAV